MNDSALKYKISVPVMNANVKRADRERTLHELRRFGASRVFLALDQYEHDGDRRAAVMTELADNCRFFKEQGFEVGSWIWTFMINDGPYRPMRDLGGRDLKNYMCPTDADFVRFATDYIRDVARCGVDIIMFDDDFRYGFLSDAPCCLCDGHMDIIRRLTGSDVSREQMAEYITSGGPNRYRDAYLKANGGTFRAFARAVRAAVDEVDPAIRIGACACLSAWDIDGVDAFELATILAGNTRPFARMIGAPYWAAVRNWGCALGDVIELERMESAWTRRGDIELFSEGDVYPRPRSLCPASYLECFDTALRAAGCMDGILKYGIDYWSRADYETGYADRHERDLPVYAAVERLFDGKRSVGVRVYETPAKLATMVMPTCTNREVNVQHLFFSKAARTLSHNTVPTVYEGDGICGIVFDESARTLPLAALDHGMILDLAAAEILTERGVDVGLESIGAPIRPLAEEFIESGNRIFLHGATTYRLTLKSGAQVLSVAEAGNERFAVSYRYENADGQRFLVLGINTRSDRENPLKHYARSEQYARAVEWLGGRKLPAYVYGNPALYIQCKKGEDGSLAVGLWNLFADVVLSPSVELDAAYAAVSDTVGCTVELDGDRAVLSDIPAFGFVAFEVKKA